jgi:hypothetical protein
MAGYRVFLVNRSNRITEHREFDCADDAEARAAAQRWLTSTNGVAHAAEIWCGAQLVSRLRKETAA